MAREIVWTEVAANELESIIAYWNDRNQSSYYGRKIRKVLRQNLKLLAIYPQLGRKTNIPLVKAKVMLDNFFIIYQIGNNRELVILNFWDCRQDPSLNKYL